MMKKFLLIGLVTTIMVSCKTKTMTLTEYNADVIGVYNPFDKKLENLGREMNAGGDNVQLQADLKILQKTADSVQTALKGIKPPADAEAMHKAMLEMIAYEKDKMLPTLLKVVAAKENPEEMQKVLPEMMEVQNKIVELTNQMSSEQQKLAAKAGVEVH